MSRDICTTWEDFVNKLAEEAGQPPKKRGHKGDASVLYRLADRTVSALRLLPHEKREEKFRAALQDWKPPKKCCIPPQTKALARLSWPLVLTTNYDDLYWSAAPAGARPIVLGRDLEDCHRVLRSLDETQSPILWALQGFLGGQCADPNKVIEDKNKRRKLANQLVVGHQQYQRAINAEGHFRRAFAEVFRRRSLLFLGSGLLEDYIVNLFGEIIHHYGPGPYPHVALLSANESERYDSWFLQTRLGVVPVFYNSYECLPDYLTQLSTLVEPSVQPYRPEAIPQPPPTTVHQDKLGFTVPTNASGSDPAKVRVELLNAHLPLPDPDVGECYVISVGRHPEKNEPMASEDYPGEYAGRYLKEAKKKPNLREREWKPLDNKDASYAFRYGDTELFAVAARSRKSKTREHATRDLGVIPDAVCTVLSKIDEADTISGEGFEIVHIGPVAQRLSDQRPHPIHAFAQTLRGVRQFIKENQVPRIRCIYLYVVNSAVWDPILSGKLSVAGLLSSDLATHRVELTDAEGDTESFAVTLNESPTLGGLLKQGDVDPERQSLKVQIIPLPTDEPDKDEPENDLVLAPTMTIRLTPKN